MFTARKTPFVTDCRPFILLFWVRAKFSLSNAKPQQRCATQKRRIPLNATALVHGERMIQSPTVGSILSQQLSTIAPDATLSEGVARLKEDVRQALAVVENGVCVGVLSESDLARISLRDLPSITPIAELMRAPQFIDPECTVQEAAQQLSTSTHDYLAVSDSHGDLVGLIGMRELLKQLPFFDPSKQAAMPPSEATALAYQQALIDNFPFPVWLKDDESRFLAVNQPFAESCGCNDPAALVGKSDLDLWPRELAESYRADDRQVMSSGRKKQVEEQIGQADQRGWFETYKAPVFNPDGSILGTVGFAREITQRMQVQTELRSHEALLRTALESTADGILVIDASGKVVTANCRFQALWGIPDELFRLGDDDKLLSFVLDQLIDPEAFLSEVKRLYGTEEIAFETLWLKDGKVIERYSVPLHQPQGVGRIWSFRDVTEREQALAALQHEQRFLKTLIKSIPDLISLKDPQGLYLACNQKFEEFFGVSESEIKGKTDHDYVDKELADSFRANDLAAIKAGKPRRNEEWITFKSNGHRALLETTKTPMYSADGELIGVLAIGHDITAARSNEQSIRDLDMRRKALMDISLDGIAIINQEHRVVEANARFCEMLGYSQEEMLQLHSWDWDALFTEAQIREHFADLTQVATRFETRHRRKDGSIFDVEISASGREVGGEPVVVTIVRDISEKNRVMQDLRAQRDLFSGGPTMVFSWRPEAGWPVAFCSANVKQLLGYRGQRMMSGELLFASLIHPDDLQRISTEVATHLVSNADSFEQEYRLRHADGHYLNVYDYTRIDRDASGKVRSLYGYLLDISRQREAEHERLRMERELQQTRKMEALGQLTGGVAHEFNNMLAIILGFTGLLRRDLASDPRFVGYLDQIEQAGARAKGLIQQMLTFSRPREHQPERIALKPAIQEALTLVRSSLPSSIEIDYQPRSGLPDVRLDTGELQQVMTNLLLNARDAMEGKGHVSITLDWYQGSESECQIYQAPVEGSWVEIAVSDDGHGIAEDALPRIFEPFFTTKPVGKGSGLGLTVVQGIVKRCGGHLLVESRPGKGTRFRMLFPPLAREIEPSQPPKRVRKVPPKLHGRVLVVDDERALTRLIKELLEREGLEVTVMDDSRDALSLLKQSPESFDVLISDQTMPEMLGTELAMEAKAIHSRIGVILYSGYSEVVNADSASEFGVDHFLTKPVSPEALRNSLEQLLGGKYRPES